MYEIVAGPFVWVAFSAFFVGLVYQLAGMLREAQKDKVVYPYMSMSHGLRSLGHWLVPFASRNMRLRPEMTVVTFAFHIGLIVTPVFLLGHNILLDQSIGIRLWTLSERTADLLTLTVISCGFFLLVRRLILPEVRYVSTVSDYVLPAVVMAPFITGFMAHHQWFDYKTLLVIHILCGGAMLIAIPFTRLRHMLFFPFTRAYMGSEFGAVRRARDW